MIGTLLSTACLNRGGRFFDEVGARRSIVLSLVALGLVLVILSFVDKITNVVIGLGVWGDYGWLLAFTIISLGFGFLRFTGQGMVTLSSRAMVGKWFDKRRGAVTAISGAIVSFFFSASPMMLEQMIVTFTWQGAWLVMGLSILTVLTGLFWLFARDNPEECGLVMDGGDYSKKGKANPDAIIYRDFTKREAQSTFAFWAFTLAFGLQSLMVTAYVFHVIDLGSELGVSSDYILGLFIPSAGISVVTGFVLAWLTDRVSFIRIKYLLFVMAVGAGMAAGALVIGDYPKMAWMHILGFGISGGCFGSLSSIVYPRFFGRTHIGAIQGVFMTTVVVASAIGPFIFSAFKHIFGDYQAGFLLCLAIAIGLAIGSVKADNPKRALAPSEDL